MAIKIKFDLAGNPEPPTIILANRNGNRLGQLDVNVESINLSDKFNDASELSFTVNKYIDGKIAPLWDKIVDFKLVYCKEWECWFEIKVELDEATETVKTVMCTQLGQAELSQIKLYSIEINTEQDIERDDYKISILYDPDNTDASILHRILKDKAPHYSVTYVSPTIARIQRSFSFDNTSILDAFQEIAKEIGCLFQFNAVYTDGRLQRNIEVYDLQQYCNDCKHRGEYTDKCPKCGSTNIKNGYGDDTLIFVTSDELASDGIQLVTDTDSVKNCFRLEAGDDLMTATVRNCNPNGSGYIWYFSDSLKEDMPDILVEKIESYNEEYSYYLSEYVVPVNKGILSKHSSRTLVVGRDVNVGETIRFEYKDDTSVHTVDNGTTGIIYLNVSSGNKGNNDYYYYDYVVASNVTQITTNETVCAYVDISNVFNNYNSLVNKYKTYNDELLEISKETTGYLGLMNAYYNTVDLALYLQSGLMPNVEMSETSAEEQAALLNTSSLSPVAVADLDIVSLATANSAVLSMAKVVVRPTYKIEIEKSELYDSEGKKYWKGSFIVTNYSDEEEYAETSEISIELSDDLETVTQQKIDKALNRNDTDDVSISALFKKEHEDFCEELKKYALNPLTSFNDACQACIDILIDQGVANEDGEKNDDSESEDGESNDNEDLYENLYLPYYNKLQAIEAEIKVREDEISIILGTYDNDGNIITSGLQTYIENYRNEIQTSLDFESYLGEELWLDFCAYRREDTYSNSNYISDGLNNAELFTKAQEFFEVAENEIYKSAELQHSISTTLNNLLAIKKFKPLVNSFKNGNWIRVQIDDQIYKLRLLEYEIDFGDFANIPVEFSDVTKVKNGISDIESILSQASSMITSYDTVQRQSEQGERAKGTIGQWLEYGLNSALVRIQSNDSEDITLTKHGLLCRSYDDVMETHSPEQFKLTHNIMAYTSDNWKTVSTALGKHGYTYWDGTKFTKAEDYGLSTKFVTAGYVTGSQIIGGEIVSSNYEAGKSGTYFNLIDGDFDIAGGKIVYDKETNILNLNNVVIAWESTNDIPTSSVSGLNSSILAIDQAAKDAKDAADAAQAAAEDAKDAADAAKNHADSQDASLSSTLTAAYEDYTNSKVSELDTAVGNYLGLGGSTLIGSNYLISPYIAGGYLNITNTNNNSRVIIDPNNQTGNGYIFQVHNGEMVSVGITQDGSASFAGHITTTSGKIGGWNIDNNGLYYGDDFSTAIMGMGTESPEWTFWSGYDDETKEAAFRVNKEGKLFASNAEITGTVTATDGSFNGSITVTDGKIGGWYIGDTGLYSGENFSTAIMGMDTGSTDWAFWSGYDSGTQEATFRVDAHGRLFASDAEITGDITATGGKIGGWSIGSNDLYYGDDISTAIMGIGTGNADYAFWAGYDSGTGNAKFRVTSDGKLYASEAEINGYVTTSHLSANYATISQINAANARIDSIDANYIHSVISGAAQTTTNTLLIKGNFYFGVDTITKRTIDGVTYLVCA